MSTDNRYLEFIYLPSFVRSAKGLLGEPEFRTLKQAIVANPEGAPVIARTGGVRKIRIALPGRGKSGSARVIYFYRATKGRIYLLLAYGKSVKDDLSTDDEKAIRAMVAQLEAER